MKTEILRCANCKTYLLKTSCPRCQGLCCSPKPAKFSVEDRWGKYRRIAKQGIEQSKSL